MPEYYNNILCVSVPELTEGSNPVIERETLHKYITRNKYIRVRKGGGPKTPALLNWDLLRSDIKARYIERYGDPRETVKSYSLKSMIEIDYAAIQFYSEYLLPDGRHLTTDKQTEYCNNAKVLNALGQIVNDRTALRKALGGSTRNIWKKLAESAARLKPKEDNADLEKSEKIESVIIAHTLPENHLRLKEKVEQYRQNGYISLVSGKFLNKNAGKVTDTQQEATMRQLLRHHNNLDNEQIRTLYNIVAENLVWDKITAQTVANYRSKWDLETHGGRKGEISFDNTKAMLIKRSAPTFPLYYWTADGWDVELLYQKTEVDGNGNSKTTYHNRLTVVLVLDPCLNYPIGYAIGTHETPGLIKEAMRNAINHTRDLFGERYKVLQLQTDNYGKKALLPIYEAVSEKFTPARVHNAKSKVVEPYFSRLNKKYCQLLPNWSGFGIASGTKKQPNTEYLNKIHSSFPDEAGVRMQISTIVESERALVREKYLAAFAEMPQEDKKLISHEEFLYLLGETTGFTNRLSAQGLVAKINGQKHEYDCFDLNFRKNADVDWILRYDPSNTDQVLATTADGSLRFMLTEKYVQPMALRDRNDGDSDQLQLVKNFNKSIKAEITAGMAKDYELVEAVFNDNPKLSDTLTKLVLTDSAGQHKDNKSAARLSAQKLLKKTGAKARKRGEKELEAGTGRILR